MCEASSPSQITFVKSGKSHANLAHVYQLDTVVCVAADRHRRLRTATRASRVLCRQQKARLQSVHVHSYPDYYSRYIAHPAMEPRRICLVRSRGDLCCFTSLVQKCIATKIYREFPFNTELSRCDRSKRCCIIGLFAARMSPVARRVGPR